ncbi:MAG: 50S ribosomal protein L4, partial [Elusimicrobiota bacterium]
ENTLKSLRNIEKVSYVTASNLSAYDLISNDAIFLNQSAIDIIKSRVEE